MEQQQFDSLTFKDEIINAFRPIEQLFKIMDKSSPEVSGDVTNSYGEIGLVLCENFRRNLGAILKFKREEVDNDHR